MRLRIYKEVSSRVPRTALHALFTVVSRHEARKTWKAGVNLVFTTDNRIKRLNTEYRGKAKPTDVLSFELDRPDNADATFGEVYISIPTAKRQALQFMHSLDSEILRLACHGFMHLFGYDHQQDKEAEQMEAREQRYLRSIGRPVQS